MRFAVSLLTILAIASVAGTVVKQNEPYSNYVFQFGQFWFNVFQPLGLFDVYHSSWFLVILGFLLLSTSLCVYRNLPLMLKEMRHYRENASETSLRLFAHHAEYTTPKSLATLQTECTDYLCNKGFRFRVRTEAGQQQDGVLIAAKAGSNNRLGYLLTHMGLVVICIGGLVDGNLPLQIQQWLGYKQAEIRDIPQSQVPAISRLAINNLSFRGNVSVPEGAAADVVFLNVGDGYFVQDLPFLLTLKKFHVEHYNTGQPKDFASDVEVTNKTTGKVTRATIRVNHPLVVDGVAIYQASFGDGGTGLELAGWSLLSAQTRPFALAGKVKETTKIANGNSEYRVEFVDFRPFNIEQIDTTQTLKPTSALAGAHSVKREKKVHNVGASVQFKIRDQNGQAREYNNYLQPILVDGRWYYLSGMRENPGENFRYLRFPADTQQQIEGYMWLRAVLLDRQQHPAIAARFVQAAMQGDSISPTMRQQLVESSVKILGIFAQGGFAALAKTVRETVPNEKEQEKAVQMYLKVLEGSAFYAWQLALEQHQQAAPDFNAATTTWFVRDSLAALSDSFFYGSPVYLQLKRFEEVKASGFQLTRAPGQNIVYGGCILLMLGVFAMFYIRERRLWLLLKPAHADTPACVLVAMSSNRRNLDFEQEYAAHQAAVMQLTKGQA